MKALVVGQSTCQVARKMTPWLARDTVDEDGHQREGGMTTPTSADKRAAHNSTPPPLLDGGQGKLTTTAYPQGVAGLCTESRYGDKDNGDLEGGQHGQQQQQRERGLNVQGRKPYQPWEPNPNRRYVPCNQ